MDSSPETGSATAHGSSHYKAAGVDYETLDAGKRTALTAALATSQLLAAHGGSAVDASRGEPAFVFELLGRSLAFVLEGLGTKAVIARLVQEQTGANRFADVAYDTVAAIVNDLCCVGAAPLVVNAYFSTGSSAWYARGHRQEELVAGWERACREAGATWGGGESPSLPGLVAPGDIELAGSAVGIVPEGIEPVLGQHLTPGDEIVLVRATGLHANGASLARTIADGLPDRYATAIADGATFGDALLTPAPLYSPLVAELLAAGVDVHYLSHITGHGLLKLMRPARALTYRITALPPVPPVLRFMVDHLEMPDAAAYSTFNMGAGFAVYVAAGHAAQVVDHASRLGLVAELSGVVEDGPRSVVLEPNGVRYDDAAMDLTPERG